ncbi:MAG: winged helix-turn-helix transcriptional regulator [Sulfolobaceae archaeon]|nr:winged helix-turn-helix transcriptional regulator [Sulfolobaceae archaeon]
MGTLLISPAGRESEKLVLKSIWKRKGIEGVLLVRPKGTEGGHLLPLLKEMEIGYQELEVNPLDFVDSVSSIAKYIMSTSYSWFVLSLSSAEDNLVNYEILTAFLLVGVDAEIEVYSNNGVVTWRVKDMLKYQFDVPEDAEILKGIKGGMNTVIELSKSLNLPLATTWRRVNKLIELGYLEKEENKKLRLTLKGEIFARLY